jgi:hypothetical protein
VITDISINNYIDQQLIAENEARAEKHESSGLLSASMLYQPLRFQVLKTIGAPRKEFEPYVLAKFKRGRDVEDWFVEQLKGAGVLVDEKTLKKHNLELDGEQPKATYRQAIGFVDSVIDTDKMQAKVGVIPNEIKSVTNAKMRRLKNGIDWHYKVQACFYALAMGVDNYAVTVISSEDLRVKTCIFKTERLKRRINQIISDYKEAMANWANNRELPKFEPTPEIPWTANIKYAMFDENWIEKSDKWVSKEREKLKKQREQEDEFCACGNQKLEHQEVCSECL